ncbi:ABC-F family ATP-binding cassette domain-containing protein [Chlorobium sp. BLA1]|uniref:ABC-F family ATP-binding cassette domain-containing protein n=1 Tax=Candidatus Chlorobium masyuteum TaxID=2716876 RepID=UPI001421989A|nr:ABC-F family ATP-binding cassette domain-containing protein [Candidatus Chlorobium masyuteum]NHQ59069.1 ABC-F family ATP-binding cassette domain-containing protein [Candidatus Chlorobium masyuteum]NTU44326.1 ABC-F family ATP-binding cassette domain-containing protein [Chlorobiaceae bacterium]
MLEARNLSLTVGTKELLVDTSFRVGDTDHVALVGLNGTGKSTLLRHISGTTYDSGLMTSGQLLKSAETTIGYLPQEINFDADLEKTALQYALLANERLCVLSEKITRMEHELALPEQDYESESYHQLIERFSDAMHEFEHLGGYTMQSDAEKVLAGLGFSEIDFHKKVKAFSGGWQMRLHLTKLLLQNPTLLLLDEPTNHLDIDSLRWLENYLVNYEHSYIIVSHDRFFLDKLTKKTLEIAFARIHEYKGNYSYYEKEKAERYELMMGKYANDLKKMEELRAFVDRFRYKATKARQAQSRLKQMEKLESQIESPEEDLSRISFRFPKAMPSGREVMRLEGVKKAYTLPDGTIKPVLKGLDLEVMRGDRIAIVGSNGAGKSTFCKIIAGQLDFEGKLTMGHNVSLNYFGQHQTESLSPEKSIYNEMLDSAPNSEAQKRVRDILGCFLFSGDAINKKIRVLSGGEKSRVALAKILLQASNLLIMDEPTNHLDMRSKEMLIESLENYSGTLLLVSHDRYFLDSLVNKVIEIKNGNMQLHLGTYAEYLEKAEKAIEAERKLEAAGRQKSQTSTQTISEKDKEQAKKSAAAKKDKKRIEEIEQKINRLEQQKESIETVMATEDFYKKSQKETDSILDGYHKLCAELNLLFAEWEVISA